ncbi:MAG: CBS domain-containing protein [Spirochaetes bacterium]|nr:CBS domain-containing protein [Spirochaetota bacterium]
MFHLFTIDGKQADLPLETINRNPRVGRVNKKYRPRKQVEIDVHEREERAPGEGVDNRYVKEAYREAGRTEDIRERVYHASEIMSSPVITIDPEKTAAEAWRMFNEHGCRHMPVVTGEGKIAGILSERDLLKRLVERGGGAEEARDILVRDIMSAEVIATGPQTDIRRVARAMLEQHLGLMPIVGERGELAGAVTRSDILHAIIHHPGFSLWA